MEKMIYRVATAICERRNADDWPCNGLDFDQEMARVAIEAMQEPTIEMINMGKEHFNIRSIWQAMIAVALKD